MNRVSAVSICLLVLAIAIPFAAGVILWQLWWVMAGIDAYGQDLRFGTFTQEYAVRSTLIDEYVGDRAARLHGLVLGTFVVLEVITIVGIIAAFKSQKRV